MATLIWEGGAPAVAQVDSLTVGGTVEATDIFIVTIGNKAVSVVGGSTNTTTVATTITTALTELNSTDYPEFAEITWTSSGAVITATAVTAGVPFTVTATTTETGGGAADDQTFVRAAVTANSGPNDWGVAANWSSGTVPVDNDDVILQDSDVSVLYGLNQTGVLLTSLTIKESFSGDIGLPTTSVGGYPEYRSTALKIGATTLTIGEGIGRGSSRIKIDLDAQDSTIVIHNTGQSMDTGLEALNLTGAGANTTATVYKGSVEFCHFAGETATIAALTVAHRGNVSGDVQLRSAAGATITALTQYGGTLELGKSPTTIAQKAGELTTLSANCTTATIDGGTYYPECACTIGTLTVSDGGVVDFSTSPAARTVTNCVLYSGSAVNDPLGVVTFTNGLDLTRCGLTSARIEIGEHFTLSKSAI